MKFGIRYLQVRLLNICEFCESRSRLGAYMNVYLRVYRETVWPFEGAKPVGRIME
jgi:hypothetical protein